MTIAAKLSRKLYETFGDEAAETMVDWMQRVDAHRTELRELNDMAFDRFDARLGQRLAEFREELRAEWRQDVRVEVEKIHGEFTRIHGEFGRIDGEFARIHVEFGKIHAEIARLGERIDTRYTDLFKWSFVFWVGSSITLMLGMAAVMRMTR